MGHEREFGEVERTFSVGVVRDAHYTQCSVGSWRIVLKKAELLAV